MSQIKSLMFCMLAVFAFCATAAASSASAADKCPESGLPALCIEKSTGVLEAVEKETITGKIEAGVESLLEVKSIPLHIECTVANATGTLEGKPLETAVLGVGVKIEFTTCTILGELGETCQVEEPIKTTALDGAFANEDAESLDVVFTPEVGTEFTTIKIKSKTGKTCPSTITSIKGVVRGEQLCTALEAEKDLAVHLLECVEAGSKLTFAEKEATFKLTEEVELSGANKGKAWSIQLA